MGSLFSCVDLFCVSQSLDSLENPMALNKPTPASLEVFDLDAARAQRYEGKADHFSFKTAGKTFTIPFELKRSAQKKFNIAQANSDIDEILVVLLGKDADRFLALDLSMQDIAAILEAWGEAAGLNAPKDEDSEDSSGSND